MGVIKFLDPTNDYAFKRIFGTEKNKDILVHFLNKILSIPDPIQSVSFLKTLQDPETMAKKQSIVDVLCQDEKGVQYIVEMQVARSEHFVKRAQFYAAKVYTNQLNKGDDYKNLKQVIFLAITDFVMFPDKPEFKSDHVILDRDSFANDLKDFSFTFLELPKFKKEIDELHDDIDRWMYFFKHASDTNPDQLEKLTHEDRMIDRAYRIVDQFYWTEAERNTYERELKNERDARAILSDALNTGRTEGRAEGKAEGKAEGLAEGLEKGKIEAKREAARHLFSLGMEIQVVASVTGLPHEDLEDLHNEQETIHK
jgi:predicted transposase/invertase (TIGR01784 family)